MNAIIPYQCQSRRTIRIGYGNVCPSGRQNFLACSVYRGGSCTDFCYEVILSRALQARSCNHRPSNSAVYFLNRACVKRCNSTKAELRLAHDTHNANLSALVYIGIVKRRIVSKRILFRPRIRMPKRVPCSFYRRRSMRLPPRCLRRRREPDMNCWQCTFLNHQCEGPCSSFKWEFQWNFG